VFTLYGFSATFSSLLLSKYNSVIKTTKMRWAGHVARIGCRRAACRV